MIENPRGVNKKEILSRYFTNPGGRVTSVTDAMPNVNAAAVTARASRAEERDVTELYWKEFSEKMGGDVINRILNEFGDDSVREDASGYVMVKGVSVLTSMEMFRHPLITGIEASTRYINWGKLSEEGFAVWPEVIMNDPEAKAAYEIAMLVVQNTYRQLWPKLWDHIAVSNPRREGQSESAYKLAVKGAVCDALRGLLPLGTRTNFAIHANYRAFSELVMNARASEFQETHEVADEIATELKKVNPHFIEVVDGPHGPEWSNYRQITNKILKKFGSTDVLKATRNDPALSVKTEILNAKWLNDLLREALVFKNGELSDRDDWELNRQFLTSGKLTNLLTALGEARTNRRHKVPDFFNAVYLRIRFENLSFGSFKDYNRHRLLQSKSEPDWTGERGFVIPKEVEELGGLVKEAYVNAQKVLAEARRSIAKKYPTESSLLLTHGTKTSFEGVMGLGELFWIAELRSDASNNPENRKIAIAMYQGIIEKLPMLKNFKNFVDTNEYSLGRIREAVRADLKGK